MYKISTQKGEFKIMYTVTLIFPKDMEALEDKFAEVMADIVSEKLNHEELGVFIDKLEKLEVDEL